MVYKCEKCGKEYVREDFYLKHISKCSNIEETFEQVEEEEYFFGIDELDEEIEKIEEQEIIEELDILEEIKKQNIYMCKYEKKKLLYDYFKVKRPYPMDSITRNKIIDLFNFYFDYNNKYDCCDGEFGDMYNMLKLTYEGLKKDFE